MADEWGAPQTSDTPATPSNGVDALLTKLEQVKRELRDLPHGLLKQAGITVVPGGIVLGGDVTVTGDMDVSGDLDVTGPTTIGGTLDVTGPTTIGGTLDVTGDAVFSGNLDVPNGSITNDALTNPLTAGVAAPAWVNNWSATNSWVTKASTTIPVPGGFTDALVFAMSSVTAVGSVIRFDIRTVIDGGAGPEMQNLTNGVAATSVSHTRSLTGLSGGTISLAAQVWSTPNLAAHTGNIASVTGFAIFFR